LQCFQIFDKRNNNKENGIFTEYEIFEKLGAKSPKNFRFPLDTLIEDSNIDKAKGIKTIKSAEILYLFERIIFPLIIEHRP
jgi:hypothetical protein